MPQPDMVSSSMLKWNVDKPEKNWTPWDRQEQEDHAKQANWSKTEAYESQ